MMDRAAFLEQQFLKHSKAEPTACQARLFREVADFVTGVACRPSCNR